MPRDAGFALNLKKQPGRVKPGPGPRETSRARFLPPVGGSVFLLEAPPPLGRACSAALRRQDTPPAVYCPARNLPAKGRRRQITTPLRAAALSARAAYARRSLGVARVGHRGAMTLVVRRGSGRTAAATRSRRLLAADATAARSARVANTDRDSAYMPAPACSGGRCEHTPITASDRIPTPKAPLASSCDPDTARPQMLGLGKVALRLCDSCRRQPGPSVSTRSTTFTSPHWVAVRGPAQSETELNSTAGGQCTDLYADSDSCTSIWIWHKV
eukprot:scaffold1473_cov375-Prasinococcus_capsulatus_cf.AAC.9